MHLVRSIDQIFNLIGVLISEILYYNLRDCKEYNEVCFV